MSHKYSNGVELEEPWRYTSKPVWADKNSEYSGWHKWIPAKIEWRGIEDTYYVGEQE